MRRNEIAPYAVFEAFVASSLWAAAHAPPEGEGMAGQGKLGYMLFLNILMKPALMVFGFFLSYELIHVVGMLIGDGFIIFATGMQAGYASGPIAFVALLALLTTLLVVASHKVFGLITWLPDNVLRWVGQQAQNLGEHNDEQKISGVVAVAMKTGAGGAAQAAMKGAGDAKKPGGPQKGDLDVGGAIKNSE